MAGMATERCPTKSCLTKTIGCYGSRAMSNVVLCRVKWVIATMATLRDPTKITNILRQEQHWLAAMATNRHPTNVTLFQKWQSWSLLWHVRQS